MTWGIYNDDIIIVLAILSVSEPLLGRMHIVYETYTSGCDIDRMKHFGFVFHGTWLDESINRGSKLRHTEAKSNEHQTRPGRKEWTVIVTCQSVTYPARLVPTLNVLATITSLTQTLLL